MWPVTLCGRCHGGRRPKGNLVLREFDVAAAHSTAETTEKMIVKLRAGMMPPPKSARGPDGLLEALVETLESKVDDAAAVGPRRGYRTFQRLNRAEYESSILDLLGLEVNAGD